MFGRKKRQGSTDKNNSSKKTLLDKEIKELSNQLDDLDLIKTAFNLFFLTTIVASLVFDISLAGLMHKSTLYKIEFWVYIVLTPLYLLIGITSIKSLNRFIKKIKEEHNIAVKERDAERKCKNFSRTISQKITIYSKMSLQVMEILMQS